MLIRLDPADSVPAGQRVVRVGVGNEHRSLALPSGSAPSNSYRALPGSVRRYKAAAESSSAEPYDTTSSADGAPAAYAARFRAQSICDAYRATDPVQPRPGLYLHVRA
jgi:hypothetical protein